MQSECKNAFVATQAPLALTIETFWDMIYQENAELIILFPSVSLITAFSPDNRAFKNSSLSTTQFLIMLCEDVGDYKVPLPYTSFSLFPLEMTHCNILLAPIIGPLNRGGVLAGSRGRHHGHMGGLY